MASPPVISYDEVGMVEDVSDIIGLISPWDTPLYTSASKRGAHNTLVEWQEDSLRAPAANAAIEGADSTIDDWQPTVMVQNRTQIFEETAQVSGTVAAVELYGRADEMDWQVLKKGRELKRDIEYAFVGTQQTAVVGSAGVARQLGGAQSLISASTTDDNSGTPRDFDESQVLAVHQACYQLGGDPNTMYVDPAKAVLVADFAYRSNGTVNERMRDMEGSTALVNVVESYRSPFGTLSVIIDRWINTTDVLLLEIPRWSVPVLRPMTSTRLAKLGDSERRLLVCELSLSVENSESSGRISDLN